MKSRFLSGAFAIILLFMAGACRHESIRPSSILDALPRLLSTGAKIVPAVPVKAASGEVFYQEAQSTLQTREFPSKSGTSL